MGKLVLNVLFFLLNFELIVDSDGFMRFNGFNRCNLG